VDDLIATALRQAQRELRTVVATNKARKDRLAAITRDRLGFQEYLDLRESIDKNISSTYSKLQKKDAPKLAKKKKKGLDGNGSMTLNGGTNHVPPAPHPAALGMSMADDFSCLVSDHLRQLVDTQQQWVDTVGGVFEQKQQDNPGRIWGLPKESIYTGIEDDVRRSIERSLEAVPTTTAAAASVKAVGEGKARKEAMDVG
jgi:transcriptional adapter 3